MTFTMPDSSLSATSSDMSVLVNNPSPVNATAHPPSGAYVNPAQMLTPEPQAGPSHYRTQKDKVAVRKRRRDDDQEGPRKSRDGPKKKKANRACAHCQKAHLTCDDARPCQRCVKRGMASTCTEGHRKKAKYLLDDDELEQLKKGRVPERTTEPTPVLQPSSEPYPQHDPLFNAFDPNFTFGSEAANLEYSILSAILGNPSPSDSGTAPSPSHQQPPQPLSNSPWSPEPLHAQPQYMQGPPSNFGSPYGDRPQLSIPHTDGLSQPSPTFLSSYPSSQLGPRTSSPAMQYPHPYAQPQPHLSAPSHPLAPHYSHGLINLGVVRTPSRDTRSHSYESSGHTSPSPTNHSTDHHSTINVTTPYDYTEGYHFLMKHLPSRFEKNDILRIVRALAIFRPSLIALQMPMTDEDEVFVEKCFQRSLLELEKLISYSGTPTVVWRRTGEICLVAPEFCMLTEWRLEDLVGKRKYIYELFENQSVVEYWENFASHAFENTTKSVYSHCVLLKPSGAPIPSTFCFSIRRDIFDLPSIVIGQWLPLL
ncbi:hypothetical protein AZE42_01766 [Rhizopogon vesiculosus]|uniref:Transcription activator of gluconeogenesis ERT1 n=1 Tax=Rhizopogon vesiculosus TaxID=180088 RepID=A0A1J8QD78_9AGAM|nr:hypothetical protein AZE42_01766 [Rhizopogon vesiculosus]